MANADDPTRCPEGHDNVVRLLSVFASVGSTEKQQAPAPRATGGDRKSVV